MNKTKDYHNELINPAIWFVWDNNIHMDDFLKSIKALEFNHNADKPVRNFNRKFKAITKKYKK